MATSRSADFNAPGGAKYRNDYEPRGGLDSKIIIKDALTLDITMNPDFRQVESDEPQVTLFLVHPDQTDGDGPKTRP